MSQLRETLAARFAFKRPFARVRSQVHFQIGQLTERLATHVALVVHFTIFLADRIRQRSVTARVARASGTPARGHVVRGRHRSRGWTSDATRLNRMMVVTGVMALVTAADAAAGAAVVLRREQMRLMVMMAVVLMMIRNVLDLLAAGRGIHKNGGRWTAMHLVQGRRTAVHLVQGRQLNGRQQGFRIGRRVRAHRCGYVALRRVVIRLLNGLRVMRRRHRCRGKWRVARVSRRAGWLLALEQQVFQQRLLISGIRVDDRRLWHQNGRRRFKLESLGLRFGGHIAAGRRRAG